MPRRYARRSDANQQEIIDALRKCGYSVESVHRRGAGFPDIIVGAHGKNYLMEIKNPEYDCKLTDDEREFFLSWRGQVDIVTSIDDALEVVARDTD